MKRGYGYREVLANKLEIQDFLNKGYTMSAVYRMLVEEKKITVCLQRFHAILAKLGIRKISLKQLKLPGEAAGISGETRPRQPEKSVGKTLNPSSMSEKSELLNPSPTLSGSVNGRTIIMKKNNPNRYTKE